MENFPSSFKNVREINLAVNLSPLNSPNLSFSSSPWYLTWYFSYHLWKWKCKSLGRVRLFATPWTVKRLVPLSTKFSDQEYWGGKPFPSPGGSSRRRDWTGSLALQADSLSSEPPGKTLYPIVDISTVHQIFNLLLLKYCISFEGRCYHRSWFGQWNVSWSDVLFLYYYPHSQP